MKNQKSTPPALFPKWTLYLALLCAILLFQFTFYSSGSAKGIPESQRNAVSDMQSQSEQNLLFSEDFDDNEITGWNYNASEWVIITDEVSASSVLTSTSSGAAYASIGTTDWSDYVFKLQARRLNSNINLYFRVQGNNAYALRLENDRLVLWTERNGPQEILSSAVFKVGSIWHDYEIRVQAKEITILADNTEVLVYSDESELASLSGGIALEIISKEGGRFDNLQVIGSTAARTDAWVQTNGPSGGVINTIEMDLTNPKVIYSGGVGGVFKSVDAGETWVHQNGFPTDSGYVYDLFINPESPNILYARTEKLLKSNDAGVTWKLLFKGKFITRLTLDRNDPDRLLIGNNQGQVWLSKDGGTNWTNVSSNLPEYKINALAFGKEDELWAGTGILDEIGNGYLYHSVNDGKSWNQVKTDQQATSEIYTLFVDPKDADVVYVGMRNIYNIMFNPKSDVYLLKTTDGGENWETLQLPFTDAMINVMQSAPFDSRVFVGTGGKLYSSNDDGDSWIDVSPAGRNGDMYDIAVNPKDTDMLYLPRRAYGIVKSLDAGKNWEPVNEGLLNTIVSLIALGDSTGSTIYASSIGGEGTYKSTDFGNTWTNVTFGGITHPWADELAVSPNDSQTIWEIADVGQLFISKDGGEKWTLSLDSYGSGFRAGTITANAVAPSDSNILYSLKNGIGIFKSEDKGNSWSFLHQSEVDYTYSLAVNPINPDVVFSGYTRKYFQTEAMVRRSLDGGESWSTALTVPNSTGITSVAIDPQKPQTIYAGSTGASSDGGGQIYRSSNNGDTWSKLNSHFTMFTIWGQSQLFGDPEDPSTAYAATWLAGIWKTTDAGKTWTELSGAPKSSTSISINPMDSNVLYAADRTAAKLWKSVDAGVSWVVAADFSADKAFLLNRVLCEGNSVYTSTFGPGIHNGKLYHSPDGGKTWKDITNGIPRSVLDIAVDPSNPESIFVTTHIYGAYHSTDGGKTWSEMSGFPDIGGYDIEVDPVSSNILYAAGLGGSIPDWVMDDDYSFKDSAGVYQSLDGGKTWKQILNTSNECRAIRISPSNPNLLFASSLSDGFFVSNDGGKTWNNYNNGLDSTNLTSVWVNDNKVYVGTQGFGVYAGDLNNSTGKVVWAADRSNKPVPDVYNLQIQVDPSDSNRVYVGSNPGGLYRSDDGGKTWYDKNFQTPSVIVDDPVRQGYYTFAINPEDPREVWVGTWGKGIYKSYDGQDFNSGANGNDRSMVNKHVNALLFHPKLGLLAATEEGVFYTQDGGATWKNWSQGLPVSQIRTLNSLSDGTVLCGTTGYESYMRQSTDAQWHQLNATANFGTFWPIWNDRPLYQYSQLLFHPTDPNIVYLGTFPAGIYKSQDGGKSWEEYNTGWPIDGVFTLIFHPKNADIVYSGTYNGINRSLDAGAHWEKWNSGWPGEQWVFSIAFDPDHPDVMYACSKNGENEGVGRDGFHGTVMKSTDGGENWSEITNGLNLDNEFYKIIVDKFNPRILYLATQYDGIYISDNGGEKWQPFNDGLTNQVAGTNGNNVTNTMVLSDDGKMLYFGTNGSGVFKRDLTPLHNQ